ncbi:MAG: FHA domain-containing protein [Chloroflexi bacterium]|uniref:FHA domain-containing protein n=1 Tax=Candidatus Chlorohelix allophototropha TaxID=3003348 RepID=A0A8T7M586_9CHLR|nr:FHA domain-containing protein [Chloroflexota bacterium]WJW69189.1 FHA domain-containing protein [Chloroflexota bacterium L227-S17]
MDISVFDIFILVLRVLLIFVLYFFLFLIVRVIIREFNASTKRARLVARELDAAPIPEQYLSPAPSNSGKLVVIETGNATTVKSGMVFDLRPVMPIGRRQDNVIILNDDYVSTEHSLIAMRDGQWWISDIASTNGTFLNGERLEQPRALRAGDVVGIGRVKFRLE